MYTKEEKEKAINLYIKYGLKTAPVIHELGYPNRKMLRIWYKKYLETKSCERKHRKPKYSESERKVAIEHYLTHGRNASYTRQVLGYPCRQIMSKWICEDVNDYKPSPLMGKHFVKYSQEEKKEAAIDMAIRNDNVTKMAKEKNVSRKTLYNWNKELISDDLNKKISDDKKECENTVESLKNEIASLQKEVYKLRMEKDILLKASELLKKDEGIDIFALSNKEKTIIINVLKDTYPLKELLSSLAISKSSYYYQCASLSRDKYKDVRSTITDIFNEAYQSYGYRRVKGELDKQGITLSEKVVRRIMKEEKLFVINIKRKKYSSYLGEISPAVENIVDRDFSADKPNEKMLTDITEFNINNTKVYLSPLVDCFDGYIYLIGL